ncbi:MAG: T9SS type A sorting domain-containing protein, partial [Bacteroidota bacterium]
MPFVPCDTDSIVSYNFFHRTDVHHIIINGVNWMDITPSADEVMDIALDPVDDDVVYISSMEEIIGNNGICIAGNKGHLHRSADRGNSWGNGPIADYTGVISIPQDNNQIIRLIDPRCPFEWYADAGTWTSTDYGVTWNKTGDIATWGKGYQASALTIWSYGSSYNGYCKTIGGSLTEPNTLFWTNVQWAFGSFDGGNTFNHLHTNEVGNDTWQSTGFDNVVMLDIDINESDNDEMYITFADIGLFRSTDGGASWQMTNDTDYTGNWDGNGGNTRSVLCDPDRPGKVWASQQGDPFEQAYLITSDQAGAPGSWTANNAGLPQSDFMLGLSIDRNSPTNNRTLYVTASGDVYKSQDDGVTWNEVLANGGLYFTKVDAVNGAKVYAGGADGLYFSENGGTSWTKIYDVFATSNDDRSPYGEQYVGISDIEVDPDVEGKVTISVYGEGVGGVFMLEGGSWSTLYLNPYMRCLSIYRENSQIMYAGSSFAFYQGFYNEQSAGVLMSQDGGSNWMAVNEDMPWHSAVTMDITNSSPPTIFVGSSGSGFQKSEVPITTNTRNISSSQEIKIQPNPFVNEIFIDLNDKDVVEGYVEVLNGLGQTVFRKKGISFPATINLSDLEEGIYFLKIENSDGEAVGIQKIIR